MALPGPGWSRDPTPRACPGPGPGVCPAGMAAVPQRQQPRALCLSRPLGMGFCAPALLHCSGQGSAAPGMLFPGGSQLLGTGQPRLALCQLLRINLHARITQMAFPEGVWGRFSSIITWTAAVPHPAWLNTHRAGNPAQSCAHPELREQLQLPSQRCPAAHQHRNDTGVCLLL